MPQVNKTTQDHADVSSILVMNQSAAPPLADETIYVQKKGAEAESQPSMSLLGEPPTYLVAQSCDVTQQHSAGQIEQIMARYEQLCKRLDDQAKAVTFEPLGDSQSLQ